MTETLYMALLAVIRAASSTTSGSGDVAAGLNTSAAALSRNAAANRRSWTRRQNRACDCDGAYEMGADHQLTFLHFVGGGPIRRVRA